MYVVKRKGLYLKAARGQKTPFTNRVIYAKIFDSRDEAKAAACGNEQVEILPFNLYLEVLNYQNPIYRNYTDRPLF
jgi:hypothetical protein